MRNNQYIKKLPCDSTLCIFRYKHTDKHIYRQTSCYFIIRIEDQTKTQQNCLNNSANYLYCIWAENEYISDNLDIKYCYYFHCSFCIAHVVLWDSPERFDLNYNGTNIRKYFLNIHFLQKYIILPVKNYLTLPPINCIILSQFFNGRGSRRVRSPVMLMKMVTVLCRLK